MRYCLVLVYILAFWTFTGAQTAISIEDAYKRGKGFYTEGRYGLAQETLKPLLQEKSSPYAPYANFYYALAAMKEGYPALARDAFLQLKRNFPKWSQMDEVHRWLVTLFCDQDEVHKAIPVTKEIKDPLALKASLMATEQHIASIDSITPLLSLHYQFPKDSIIGKYLAKAITRLPYREQDRDLLKKLVSDLELDPKEYGLLPQDAQYFKDEYNIVALLPFLMDRTRPDLSPKFNQFVFDLYQGMIMAVDTLNLLEGSKILLHSYDTKRDSASTMEILATPELSLADFIVGPLYNSHLVHELSLERQINVANPLSSNMGLLDQNPYYFLPSPPPEEIAEVASRFALNNFTGKNGVIFYGPSKRDYLLAKAFADTVRANGHHILDIKRITAANLKDVLLTLTNVELVNEIDTIINTGYMDSIEYVFVSSEDKTGQIYANVLPGIDARLDTVEVLGSRNWFEDGIVDLGSMEKLNVRLCAPGLVDYYTGAYERFEKEYIERFGIPPTKYAIIGYEMIYYVGSMLKKYGRFFQTRLEEEKHWPGLLTYGFNYEKARYNSAVPVVGVVDGKVTVIKTTHRQNESNEQDK